MLYYSPFDAFKNNKVQIQVGPLFCVLYNCYAIVKIILFWIIL